MNSPFLVLLRLFIYLTAFVGWIFGSFHAFEEHSKFSGVVSFFVVVPSYYYAVEGLGWHKDTKGDEKLKLDTKLFAFLVNKSMDIQRGAEEINLASKVNAHFNSYSDKNKDKLKKRAALYIVYATSVQRDFLDWAIAGKELSSYTVSPKITEIENKLNSIGLESEVKINQEAIKSLSKQEFFESLSTRESREVLSKNMEEFERYQAVALNNLFKDVFGEEIIMRVNINDVE